MKRPLGLVMAVASIVVVSSACSSTAPADAPGAGGSAASATATSAVDAADKEWTMQNKNAASTRYSSVNEINSGNVKNLRVAWTFSTGVLRGHEGGPLVVGNTM